ncbi:MAG: hypothetical protein KJ598_03615, partial [Nanoarchaeota archaeon]|nr:hypothetical protein [Nanoarchaeota archaeon]MBU1644217.1 hypothetical protein [Nanoarchaeota archaeon]
MKFTSDRARYTFEVLLSNGMKEEEALLFIARYHGKGEELARASEDNVSSHFFGIYRTSKKEGFDLLGEVCLPQSDLERRLILDDKSVDNGKKKTPDNWFKYWSKVKDGRVMASMGDLYQSFKLIKKMRESGTTEEQAIAQRYLNSLLEDFDWPGKKNWLVSSTRLIYSGNSLDTRIIHHYQSNRLELTKEVILEVPIYRGIEIEDVFSSDRGSAYLQALLDTEDDPEMII